MQVFIEPKFATPRVQWPPLIRRTHSQTASPRINIASTPRCIGDYNCLRIMRISPCGNYASELPTALMQFLINPNRVCGTNSSRVPRKNLIHACWPVCRGLFGQNLGIQRSTILRQVPTVDLEYHRFWGK